jgi:phosphoglycerate kinase
MSDKLPTLDCLDVKDKTVLLRCDFNVPMKEGAITEDIRIQAALPTLNELFEKGARVLVLMSHLGRPKGTIKEELRLQPVGTRLSELLKRNVISLQESVGDSVKKSIAEAEAGSVVLLENVRFHKGETKGDEDLAKQFSELADCFVLDAFGTCHRAHASVVGPCKHLPKAAGRLVEKEIENLGRLLKNPQSPFVTIVGGAKVSDKVEILENLMTISDLILIGGGMAYTFLKEQGHEVGNSLCENDKLDLVKKIRQAAKEKNCELLLPLDHVVGKEFANDTESATVDEIPADSMALDIGPKTIALYSEKLKTAKTILWNGPMGVFEFSKFAAGTRQLGQSIQASNAFSVVGGGDSVAAVKLFGLEEGLSHISTGGGASLEFLTGINLPGIAALTNGEALAS